MNYTYQVTKHLYKILAKELGEKDERGKPVIRAGNKVMINYINETFGLKYPVIKINIVG